MRVVAGLLTLAAVVAGASPAGALPNPEKLIAKADRRFDKGDYDRAAKLYAKADRAAEGRSVPALVGLARASVRAGDYAETITAAQRWRRLDGSPESRAGALFFEGLGHYWQGMTARWDAIGDRDPPPHGTEAERPAPGTIALRAAVRAFLDGLSATPESAARASTLLFLADALLELGEEEAAAEALDAYAAAGGDDPYADNLRCWIEQLDDQPEFPDVEEATITPPEKIYAPHPQYTDEARAAGAEGSMLLKAALTAQGDVRCLRVVRGLPFGMVQSATETVRQWRFRPALHDGQPVMVRYFLTIDFKLR